MGRRDREKEKVSTLPHSLPPPPPSALTGGQKKGKVLKKEKEEARGEREKEKRQTAERQRQRRDQVPSTALTILVAAPAERPLRFPTAHAHNVLARQVRRSMQSRSLPARGGGRGALKGQRVYSPHGVGGGGGVGRDSPGAAELGTQRPRHFPHEDYLSQGRSLTSPVCTPCMAWLQRSINDITTQ